MSQDSDEGSLELEPVHLHDGDMEQLTLVDGVDFILSEDPTTEDDDGKWVAQILEGTYLDWVVRFPRIVLDKGELDFNYEVLFHPPFYEGYEIHEHDVANYMGELLSTVLLGLQEGKDGLIYFDQETGEQIDI